LKQTNVYELTERYDGVLLDAYGVLINAAGICPGAVELIEHLNSTGKTYYILTNDASKLPQSSADKFADCGLSIRADRIITSGGLLKPHFVANALSGAPSVVLGPPDSSRYVEIAGGRIVSYKDPFDVLVIADESGFPFLETVDGVLSALFRKVDSGNPPSLLLPNPDLIYPKADSEFGIASGSIAVMIEAALSSRYPSRTELRFTRLGKPHPPIFNEAMARAESRNMLMIGDQLETDIRGARAVGLDSALVAGGVSVAEWGSIPDELLPTFMVSSIER
jgi:HAD superfamily hydrolase (TIGR01450 family)